MNVALTRATDRLPRREFTVEDIRRMVEAGILSEEERFELIEGDLVMMSAKGNTHERVKNELNLAIARALPADLMLGIEMTVQFSDSTMLEPDIAVFARKSLVKSDANFSYLAPGGLLLAIECLEPCLRQGLESAPLCTPPGPGVLGCGRECAYHLDPHGSRRR
jgi:Uma2 family endonuclease